MESTLEKVGQAAVVTLLDYEVYDDTLLSLRPYQSNAGLTTIEGELGDSTFVLRLTRLVPGRCGTSS